jgi:hypothetical protein
MSKFSVCCIPLKKKLIFISLCVGFLNLLVHVYKDKTFVPCNGHCHHGMACTQIADRGTASIGG